MKHSILLAISPSALALSLLLSGGCSDGGGGHSTAILGAPSRSTNVALTSDDRLLVVANRDTDTVTLRM